MEVKLMEQSKRQYPKLRFRGFTDPWEQRQLNEISERVTRKNKKLESTLPLTISAQDGLIDQSEFFDRNVASKDVSGYFLVKNGEFAYNKSYSNGYPFGAIKRLDRYSLGVLSTLYIVFRPTKVDSQFLATYYDSGIWYREIYKRAAEGARNHGLLNISPTDFFDSELTIPKNESEQVQIGKMIKSISELIASNQRKVDKLKELKKGYMQKLFPKDGSNIPELRFPGFTDPWEQRKLNELSYIFIGLVTTMTKNYTSAGTLLIRNSDIKEMHFEFDEKNIYLRDEFANKNKNRKLLPGDVVTVHTGDIGTSSVITGSESGAIGFATINTRPDTNKLRPSYLALYLNTDRHKNFAKRMSTGDGRSNYNLKDFTKLNLPIPNVLEQEKISNILSSINQLIASNQRKLDKLKELKKGYMQQLFI